MTRYFIPFLILLIPCSLYAQAMDSTMNMMDSSMQMSMPERTSSGMTSMSGGVSAIIPMSQEGSGTSWHPASSPTYAAMYHYSGWMTMLHGHASPRYTYVGGKRGDTKWDMPNYIMGMTQHDIGEESQFLFRTMLSLDWLTEGGYGYPLLLQTGETWQGKRLVDRQHPHDLFAELSTTFSTKFSETFGGYLYLAYPGEPALGPPAFMHRQSAMSNPDAPIGHHWQDATHITFGVITLGVNTENLRFEGSLFNGREPDENRTDFDTLRIDSWSARVSWNPTTDLALQASYGFLNDPERDNSNETLRTISAIYTRNYAHDKWWSSTLVLSVKKDHHATTDQPSLLLESEAHYAGYGLYLRGEMVEKPQTELGLAFDPTLLERVSQLTLGVNRRLFDLKGIDVDFGLQGTMYDIPTNISFIYGPNPLSFEVYVAIHPKEL